MILLTLTLFLIGSANACSVRQVADGIICVCNSTYCDTVPGFSENLDKFNIYTTGAERPGFNLNRVNFTSETAASTLKINIDQDSSFQTIIGFGGAFTDATGTNIKSLPEEAQQKLLESYFGDDGIGYSVCRVPIGGTDFSPRPYSYDDVEGDVELEYFQLQTEDQDFKIPYIQQALSLRGENPLRLFATAWTAPTWMKTAPIWNYGFSMLKQEYYQLWADYTKKFLDEYDKQGIQFWGLTTGNEPLNGFYRDNRVNSMGWTPLDHARWIVENLGPVIRNSSHKDIKIMIHDESTLVLPFVVPVLLADDQLLEVIDGIATHWYWDSSMAPEIKTLMRSDKKDLFALSSEACYFQTQPLLGSWSRAAGYISSIIEYLQYDFVGWIDWNMVLNSTGGFTYVDWTADSPVIISEDAQEFYKQPLFYAMGHFSKFVVPDSIRVDVSVEDNSGTIESVAFTRPDDLRVVIIHNKGSENVETQIVDGNIISESFEVAANSITTAVYLTLL